MKEGLDEDILYEKFIGNFMGLPVYERDEFKEMVRKKLRRIKQDELHNNTNK